MPNRFDGSAARRSIVSTGALALVATLVGPPLSARADDEAAARPNFVLLMTDDQGWGDVAYNGLTKIPTPHLDAMAAAGIRFDRFYAAASTCSPTRGSVLTGRHPARYGIGGPGAPLKPKEKTIAQALQAAGYATGHFGKWHLNGRSGPGKPVAADDPLNPGTFGFDEWLSVSNYFETDWTLSRRGKDETFAGDGSDYIVGEALKFVATAVAAKKPYFAVVWYGNPHSPHRALPADLEAAKGSAFHGEIVAIDRSVGHLRSELRRMGLAENTLVWFCSDNGATGPGSTGGLRGKKGSIWEGGVRVPGIVEWPARIRKPFVTRIPAVTSDILPTLAELAGVPDPAGGRPVDGVSLVPLFDGRMTERPRPIGFAQGGGHAAWSGDRYKLHRFGEGRYELYDLVADAAEERDLAGEKPEIVAAMKPGLEAWLASVRDSSQGKDYPAP